MIWQFGESRAAGYNDYCGSSYNLQRDGKRSSWRGTGGNRACGRTGISYVMDMRMPVSFIDRSGSSDVQGSGRGDRWWWTANRLVDRCGGAQECKGKGSCAESSHTPHSLETCVKEEVNSNSKMSTRCSLMAGRSAKCAPKRRVAQERKPYLAQAQSRRTRSHGDKGRGGARAGLDERDATRTG